MNRMKTYVVASLLFAVASARASNISSIVVYGDSLSDNGNLYSVTGQPAAPYYNGRASNGPVAVEQLAQAWNVPLFDFAWSGATTGIGNHLDGGTPIVMNSLPGMTTSFLLTQGLLPTPASTLFIVWGGPDDFLSPAAGDSMPGGVIARAVADISAIVLGLEGLGATHILVPGMPDLGLTPFYMGMGAAAAGPATLITDAFNAALANQMLQYPGVTFFDTAALLRSIVSNPAAYGFTNVTDQCLGSSANCATYLFWDDLHPTTAGHAVLADAFGNAVPEPVTGAIVVVMLFAIAARRYCHHRV